MAPWLTIPQVVKREGMSADFWRDRCADNTLLSRRLGNGKRARWLIDAISLAEYLSKRTYGIRPVGKERRGAASVVGAAAVAGREQGT